MSLWNLVLGVCKNPNLKYEATLVTFAVLANSIDKRSIDEEIIDKMFLERRGKTNKDRVHVRSRDLCWVSLKQRNKKPKNSMRNVRVQIEIFNDLNNSSFSICSKLIT